MRGTNQTAETLRSLAAAQTITRWTADSQLRPRIGNVGPVIKFHYHTAVRDVPRMGVHKGDPLCHVYSDTSLEELVAWGRAQGLRADRIDRRNVLPHYDAHDEWLEACGEGVTRSELVADIRAWRDWTRGNPGDGATPT